MAARRDFSISETVKSLKERIESKWFQESCHAMPEADILARVQAEQLSENDLYIVRLALQFLASWYIGNGGMAVLKGEQSGWEDVRQGVVCECTAARLHYFTMIRLPADQRSGILADDGAMALMLALAMDEVELAHRIGEVLLLGVTQGIFSKFNQIGFEPFALRLYGMRVGRDLSQAGFDPPDTKECYAQVFEHWRDTEKLGRVLENICNVHVECDRNPSEDGYAQFPHEPMGACPMEICAILGLRKRMLLDILHFRRSPIIVAN